MFNVFKKGAGLPYLLFTHSNYVGGYGWAFGWGSSWGLVDKGRGWERLHFSHLYLLMSIVIAEICYHGPFGGD